MPTVPKRRVTLNEAQRKAREMRRDIACDLVDETIPAAYEALKLLVIGTRDKLRQDPQAVISRQNLDGLKVALTMGGVAEVGHEKSAEQEIGRLSWPSSRR
jgi:hypothetical protein